MSQVEILDGPVIAAGESLSDAIDCSAGRVVRITTPAGWDHAKLSFQVSTDGVGFSDLYSFDGEVTLDCGPKRGIMIHQLEYLPGLFLKFRSGTAQQPVIQSDRRQFAIALLVEAEEAPAAEGATRKSKMEAHLQEQIDQLARQHEQLENLYGKKHP